MNGHRWFFAALLCSATATAGVQEIGGWQVESLSDDFSFSALGSMVTVARGFDRAAGTPPNLLIVGCDADPDKGHQITAKMPREGFHVIPQGGELEIDVSARFDTDLPLEGRWLLYNNGPFLGAEVPREEHKTLVAALAKATTLTVTYSGVHEARIPDRVVEFDVSQFTQALGALVCGTNQD